MRQVNYVEDGVADGEKSKSIEVPHREDIRSLMYKMLSSRPDIACSVSIPSRICDNPKLPHWVAVKMVIKYLEGTINEILKYDDKAEQSLVIFCDADYAGCLDSC